MLSAIHTKDILFIDIETVPLHPSLNNADETTVELWEQKSKHLRKEGESAEEVYGKAGLWAEFGRIICLSMGFVFTRDGKKQLRIKSFYHNDERQLLVEASVQMEQFFAKRKQGRLCAHNGKEFDFPYIARRMLINGIELPHILDVAGKKPWEVPFLDTMDLWRFGDYKYYTSLKLLAHVFGIPSPKDDLDGSMVADVYYNEQNLERIVRYCEKDVLAIAQLMLKYKGESDVECMEEAE